MKTRILSCGCVQAELRTIDDHPCWSRDTLNLCPEGQALHTEQGKRFRALTDTALPEVEQDDAFDAWMEIVAEVEAHWPSYEMGT